MGNLLGNGVELQSIQFVERSQDIVTSMHLDF